MNENENNYLNRIFDGLLGGAGNSIVEEALKNDKRLENVIVYKLTEGYTKLPKQAKMDKMLGDNADMGQLQEIIEAKMRYQDRITDMFKEFKEAIKRKSVTLEELEEKIYSEYGVVNPDWYDRANPLEAEGFHFKEMSEEDYKIMRESYHGEEKTEE